MEVCLFNYIVGRSPRTPFCMFNLRFCLYVPPSPKCLLMPNMYHASSTV